MKNEQFVLIRSAIAIAVALAFPAGVALADEVQDLTNPNVSDVSIHIQDFNRVNPQYRYYSGINQDGATYSVDANVVNRDANGDWLKIQARDLGIPGIQEFGISYEKQGDWRAALDYNEITKYAPFNIATGVAGIGSGVVVLPQNVSSTGGPTSLSLERTSTSISLSKFFSDNLKANLTIGEENKSGAINAMESGTSRVFATTAQPGTLAAGPLSGPPTFASYSTQMFAPQPEDYKHTQVTASVDYFTKTFQFSVGYYGSFFTDSNTALNVQNAGTLPGTGNLTSAIVNGCATTTGTPAAGCTAAGSAGNGPFLGSYPWVSLPASNHYQQLYVDGAYAFSNSTHFNFKVATAQTVQDATFLPITPTSYNPPGVAMPSGAIFTNTNLGGLIDTTSAAFNLTSRLANNLDFLASWRYESRDDKTPIEGYGGGTTTFQTNYQNSETVNNGKLELGYRFGEGYKLVGDFKYDGTATPVANNTNSVSWRDKVNEDTFSVALRKSMSETLNGSFTLSHANRTGSPWILPTVTGVQLAGQQLVQDSMVTAPLQWGDRTRDAAKLLVDWTVTPALSAQAFYEFAQDKYSSQPWLSAINPLPLPTPGISPQPPMEQMGLTNGRSNLVGLDATYAINKNWKASAFVSYNLYKTDQNELHYGANVGCGAPSAANAINNPAQIGAACVPFGADFDMSGGVVGASLTGSVGAWALRAKYTYEKDVTEYNFNVANLGIMSPVAAGAGSLTDSVFTINRLQLTAVYPYSKATTLRFDYLFDLQTVADYAYAQGGWGPSDGTQLIQPPRQITQAVGVTLTQAF